MKKILPICLAGGKGQRLAPISTPQCTKPFVTLADGSSLLQLTLRRIKQSPLFSHPLIIGAESERFALLNHARLAQSSPHAILLEPMGRNTALAVASAVAFLSNTHAGDTVLALLPADHVIEDTGAWEASLARAARHAQSSGEITLIGMALDTASREYGYMQLADAPPDISSAHTVHQISGFVEKPHNASELVATGRYLTHSGQVIATLAALIASCEQYAPNLWSAALQATRLGAIDQEFFLLDKTAYEDALPIAFDRAILEKQRRLCAISSACGWSDIGTVSAFTSYAKENVSWFKAQPLRVHRPWGYYDLISATPNSQVKRLYVFPGARISMQRHAHRAEHWTIISGIANVELDDKTHILDAGESLVIAQNAWHRLSNYGASLLQIMEVQTGLPDEADIERAADDYGRV